MWPKVTCSSEYVPPKRFHMVIWKQQIIFIGYGFYFWTGNFVRSKWKPEKNCGLATIRSIFSGKNSHFHNFFFFSLPRSRWFFFAFLFFTYIANIIFLFEFRFLSFHKMETRFVFHWIRLSWTPERCPTIHGYTANWKWRFFTISG